MVETRLHTNYPADNQKRMPGNKEIPLMGPSSRVGIREDYFLKAVKAQERSTAQRFHSTVIRKKLNGNRSQGPR